VVIHGGRTHAFPGPSDLRDAAGQLDLWEVKRERLNQVAAAAIDGRLEAARLRSLDPEDALDQLQQLSGVGPFSAELILLRGAGHPDRVPSQSVGCSRRSAPSTASKTPRSTTFASSPSVGAPTGRGARYSSGPGSKTAAHATPDEACPCCRRRLQLEVGDDGVVI
jgi:hypothetical protein